MRWRQDGFKLPSNPTLFYTFGPQGDTHKLFDFNDLGMQITVPKGTVPLSPLFSTTFNATLVTYWYEILHNTQMPQVTTYSDLRAHLKSHCDRVAETGEPLIIRRRGGADVALVSLEELSGLEETAHLLRSPENGRRLLESMEEVRSGNGVVLTVAELRSKFGLDE